MKQEEKFDAEGYVRKNYYTLSLGHDLLGKCLRCIDDRASNSDDKIRDIAVPGSGLGMVMDVLGAFTLLRRNGKDVSLEPSRAIDVVERALGIITFHTDEKCEKEVGIICGGCGHCNSALAHPEEYLISGDEKKYFLEIGLKDIKRRFKKNGFDCAVYVGGHNASAVIIVDTENIGLPSVGENGVQVYVYHKVFHERILSLLAHELMKELSLEKENITEEELKSALFDSARIRLSLTVEHLAHNLPKFRVSDGAGIFVEAL